MRYDISQLGAAIKTARQNKNLTQIQLAEQLNISLRHLQSLENEHKTPSYNLLIRMLDHLDIPLENLMHPESSHNSIHLERLIYLLRYKCTDQEICVLTATAEALIQTRR